jgi:nucleotide-binding universal stress UspA family protein
MPYRKILAPIFGAASDRRTLQAGITVAKQFVAHLEVFFVRYDPFQTSIYSHLSSDLTGQASKYLIEAAIRSADEAQEIASASFAKAIEKSGVVVTDAPVAGIEATAEFKVVQGGFVERIEHESRLSDLIVFSAQGGDTEQTQEALEGALLSGSRPVLFVSAGLGGAAPGQRIAIAFDGSAAAAHAVTAALPFIKHAKAVHAFEVTATPKASTALADLARYLALHGVDAATHSVDPGRKSTETALLAAVQDEHCDMLVLGGYGHSRVREFVFGGVTRHVLRGCPLPAVLMAH